MEALAPAASEPPRAAVPVDNDPRLFINRELSSLAFFERVLEEACDPAVPALERLKFLAIVGSALDEFFMIRVAGLKQQLAAASGTETGADAMSPAEQLAAISSIAHELVLRQRRALLGEVLPTLERSGVRLLGPESLPPEAAAFVASYFEREVLPVLTPIALDPGHPFPHLRNKSLNLAVRFTARGGDRFRYGIVPVPSVLPRLVQLPAPAGQRWYALLEDVIARHVQELFPGTPVDGRWPFRVTRNWDLSIDEEEAEDLLVTIEREVRRRDRGSAVRLQISASADDASAQFLARALHLADSDIYRVEGPLDLQALVSALRVVETRELRDEPFAPVVPDLGQGAEIFATIRARDVLLHHPYESFDAVVSFIEAAAEDPNVLAIKQTLYRTGKDSPIVRALQRAAENGKQVTAIVELKARMDEEANILWARALEQSGVHVVYGLIGIKTHCKVCLVVRREGDGLRRYVHLGTGNYNPGSARSYSDLSLLTSRPELGADATSVFNLLTGYSKPASWSRFLVAPLDLKAQVLALINDEARLAAGGKPGRIVAKMNALSDADVIKALYRAAQAGVSIELIVRGICCLRPGVPGVSERIRVTGVVDRFLEHARVWFFEAGGERKLYLSSADWMPRNFVRRVEIAFAVEDPELKARVLGEILATSLADNVKARVLGVDGRYTRVTGSSPLRSQERFMQLARRQAEPQPDAPAGPLMLMAPARKERRRRPSARK